MIQAWDVDPSESWPDGQNREENQTVPVPSDGGRGGRDRPAAAKASKERPQAGSRLARGGQRDPLHGALRRRLAHAAEQLPALADGLLVVPPLRVAAAVPPHP